LRLSAEEAYRMAMPHTSTPADRWTVERVRALPDDGQRYEVVDGELLVTPAPRLAHQAAILGLQRQLDDYLRGHRVGWVLASPADIVFDPGTLVQPDLFVAPSVEGRRPREWSEITRLLLAVEVLSPGTAALDRGVKRRLYQRQRTGEYWIVDLDAMIVERWRPGDERPEVLDGRLEWQPQGASEALTLDVVKFFRDAWGE
jgi:Uma2 family endonuclease